MLPLLTQSDMPAHLPPLEVGSFVNLPRNQYDHFINAFLALTDEERDEQFIIFDDAQGGGKSDIWYVKGRLVDVETKSVTAPPTGALKKKLGKVKLFDDDGKMHRGDDKNMVIMVEKTVYRVRQIVAV
tara:strand:+ start:1865 stop:2248 length:384 start_codon:yes stop_codon:yes gene_type:complete